MFDFISLATREVDAGMNGGQLGRKPITNNSAIKEKKKFLFFMEEATAVAPFHSAINFTKTKSKLFIFVSSI